LSGRSISFVLLALNEEASIGTAIAECRAFGREHCEAYEIVVVDDGSTDRTSEAAQQASEDDVVLIRHDRNQGMGAAMRDGYLVASMDYIAHLPGDRQVRASCLREMIVHCSRTTIALSTFANPPSGRQRAIMSAVFRVLLQRVGGFRVDFAGTYLFHRQWLSNLDMQEADSETFLYSFQLLELFKRAGAQFYTVPIQTYLREEGVSRVATVPRIANMFREIARARLRSLW